MRKYENGYLGTTISSSTCGSIGEKIQMCKSVRQKTDGQR